MRTSKPISTISYNTEQYLTFKLEELRKAKVIEFWAFIYHKAEKDEGKDHWHVYMIPARMLQTMDLEDQLKEPDLKHPDKPPLGVRPFESSKFPDWYLYGLHDPAYLASKRLSREYRYVPSDYRSSDLDHLNDLVHKIDFTAFNQYKLLQDAMEQKIQFAQFVKLYSVPIQQIKAYETAWNLMAGERVERDGKTSHTPKNTPQSLDPDTGEVLDSPDDESPA